jgi:5'-nucleotidase
MGKDVSIKHNILVVNDDGIGAIGIRKLVEGLSEAGDVYVSSPHEQQSASGHGISLKRPIYIEDVCFAGAKQAISMKGTPADCVKLGLEVYRRRGIDIDMVFSGFNHGMNLGTDTLYSGTVSAAIEGAICGLPSAAMSISSNLSYHRTPVNFEKATELAKKIATSELFGQKIKEKTDEPDIHYIHERHVILNVNIPDLPADEIKGVKVCPLSYRAYNEWFNEKTDDEGRDCYQYAGKPWILGEADPDESDIIANNLGYITITPLHFDLTDRETINKIRDYWNE